MTDWGLLVLEPVESGGKAKRAHDGQTMTNRFKYTGCGLDYVYLSGGYHEVKEDGEVFVSIENAEQLHEVIAEAIISSSFPLRGQEVRFLRGRLRLSQEGFAEDLGDCSRSTVARWEAERDVAIDGTADGAIRWLFVRKMTNDNDLLTMLKRLREQDEAKYGKASQVPPHVFEASGDHWKLKEAA